MLPLSTLLTNSALFALFASILTLHYAGTDV
eukprot:COSAG05_NODE_2296_length_3264_cov_2.037283_2_plen_31_part_00